MIDILLDSVIDTLKLLPFLFLTYLFMEYIEHKTNSRIENAIEKCGKSGPLIGGVLGMLPQCGFSSVAANFYAGKLITLGTLVAIFISTSDEMLPIFIASAIPAATILKILFFKLGVAVIAGFAIDFILHRALSHDHEDDIHPLCEKQNCNCHGGSIFSSAARHTLNICIFIFIITFLCGILVHFIGTDTIGEVVFGTPVLGEAIAALVGIIPNCASSVIITQMYLDGLMPPGAMISGLIMNSGVGLAVLFKMNSRIKENFKVAGAVFVTAVLAGVLVSIFGITF